MQLSNKAYELIKSHFNNKHDKRLKHVEGVAKMAELLANRYKVNPDIAKACGYFHDYSKYDDYSEASKYLSQDEIAECEKYPFLYHAYLSAYHFKELVSDDLDMFNAIYNHVFGRPNMSKLEEIIMIADFTEENREYDDCIRVRKILLDGDMDKAIYESLKATIDIVIKKGETPHPRQLAVFKEYEERIKR